MCAHKTTKRQSNISVLAPRNNLSIAFSIVLRSSFSCVHIIRATSMRSRKARSPDHGSVPSRHRTRRKRPVFSRLALQLRYRREISSRSEHDGWSMSVTLRQECNEQSSTVRSNPAIELASHSFPNESDARFGLTRAGVLISKSSCSDTKVGTSIVAVRGGRSFAAADTCAKLGHKNDSEGANTWVPDQLLWKLPTLIFSPNSSAQHVLDRMRSNAFYAVPRDPTANTAENWCRADIAYACLRHIALQIMSAQVVAFKQAVRDITSGGTTSF